MVMISAAVTSANGDDDKRNEQKEIAGPIPKKYQGSYHAVSCKGLGRLEGLVFVHDGRIAYLTYEPDGEPFAMASLLPSTGGGWLLEGVHGVKNTPLTAEQQAPLRAWLTARGVHGVKREPLADGWRAAMQLVGVSDHELVEFDDLNDLLSAAA